MRKSAPYVFLIPLIGMVVLLFYSSACREGVKNGLSLCGAVLIPSLFPFSVLSSLVLKTGFPEYAQRRFGSIFRNVFLLPGSAAGPFVIGLLGGYPLGIHSLCELYRGGFLTRKQAIRLSVFCNNPGPAFLIGAIGAVCMDAPIYGLLLFGITILSSILIGILLSSGKSENVVCKKTITKSTTMLSAFPQAVTEAVQAMLRVSGIVVFFSAILPIILQWLEACSLPTWLNCLTVGSLELTSGIAFLQKLPISLRFLLCAFLTNWGGICVHLQSAALLADAGLPITRYLAGKGAQAFISLLLAAIPYMILFQPSTKINFFFSCLAIILLSILLFYVFSKNGIGKMDRV